MEYRIGLIKVWLYISVPDAIILSTERGVTDPAAASSSSVAGVRTQRLSPSSGKTWFHTREGRRYGWEIALIIVVKLVLLIVLWLVFIRPWPHLAAPPAAVVHQLYSPAAPAVHHD